MCGRYTRKYTWREVHDFLDLHFPQFDDPGPSFNVAPTQCVPVLTGGACRCLQAMRWGLVPAWAEQDAAGFINARAETAATKPAFRAAWRSRRCLIPATGFYEWQTVGKSKRPFHFTLLNDPIFCIAALWEPPAGRACVPTCAILTVPANPLVAEYHDRMPAILRPDAYDAWLDGPLPDPACLGAFPAEEMSAARASERVNSPRNDAPDLLEPERGLF